MTKRFYIILSVFCVLACAGLLFFYKVNLSSSADTKNTVLNTLQPKVVEQKKKEKTQPVAESEKPKEVQKFTMLAVGDIMLDRSVMLKTQAAKNWNHPFLLIDPLFQEYNLRMANLEGPITTNKSIANGTGGARFTFTFSPNFVDPLKQRFEFLSLANNHAHNFGQKGLDQTRTFLDEAKVKYFGGPNNVAGQISVTSSYNGITFGFVGYHQLVEQGFENVLAEVRKLDAEVDIVIAVPHWGPEYQTDKPSPAQTRDAYAMIDAGADLIIGAHPHVVQPIEIYKDKVIFYSLGNFIFDQYFSEETMTGLALGMTFEKITEKNDLSLRTTERSEAISEITSSPETPRNDSKEIVKIDYKLIPLDINKVSQPSVAVSPKKEKVLNHLYTFSKVDASTKEKIKLGNFSQQITK